MNIIIIADGVVVVGSSDGEVGELAQGWSDGPSEGGRMPDWRWLAPSAFQPAPAFFLPPSLRPWEGASYLITCEKNPAANGGPGFLPLAPLCRTRLAWLEDLRGLCGTFW